MRKKQTLRKGLFRWLWEKYWGLNIRPQLIVGFLISILAPLILFGTFVFRMSDKQIQQETEQVFTRTAEQINMVLDEYINQIDKIAMGLYTNDSIPQYLRETSGYYEQDAWELRNCRRLAYEYLENMVQINQDVWSVSVVSLNGEVLTVSQNGHERANSRFWEQPYYRPLIHSDGNMTVLPTTQSGTFFSKPHTVFTIGRRYLDVSLNENDNGLYIYTGCVFVECSQSILKQVCEKADMGKYGQIYVLDEQGTVIYTTQEAADAASGQALAKRYSQAGEHGCVETEDGKMLLVGSRSSFSDWTIMGTVSYREVLERGKNTRVMFFLLCSICIVAVLAASLLLSKRYVRPIKNLQNAMRAVQKGNRQTQVAVTGKNEFAELGGGFNLLVKETNRLLLEVKQLERKNQGATYKLLSSQMNPHFLYNTLDSIRMMAVVSHNKQIAKALEALADLFRYNSKPNKELMPIRQEVEYVRNYIALQKIRFGERFEVEFEIDEEIFDAKILKLTLQPLVENAILHGFSQTRSGGLLRIRIKQEEKNVLVSVEDNGQGMSKEQLEKLSGIILSETDEGLNSIGLKTTNDRLILCFGETSRLCFDSALHTGTKVWFRIPKYEEDWKTLPLMLWTLDEGTGDDDTKRENT